MKCGLCYCIILYDNPDVNGVFERRCEIHKDSLTTVDVFKFCEINKPKPDEIESFIDTNGKQQIKIKQNGIDRITALMESTRRK